MQDIAGFTSGIWDVNDTNFNDKALAIFHWQAAHNPVYAEFLHNLDRKASSIRTLADIPFLPISAFKHHPVISGDRSPVLTFESSGTTGMQVSRHAIVDPILYTESYRRGFTSVYGDPSRYCILALLPSYLERSNSSLVYMCDGLIRASGHPDSGFYLHDLRALSEILANNARAQTPTLLIGVSFALLDLAAEFPVSFPELLLMETGGMKGRREEITRAELHTILKAAFGVPHVHSEYGMTELLSQAYALQDGLFQPPPWMRILIRDAEDPLALLPAGATGCINVIDLANVYSCSFIATDDLGKVRTDGRFDVLGRYDTSDLRGCNLMVE